MPLKRGSSKATIQQNIREFAHGSTFAKTKAKFGSKKAISQAVAVAYRTAGKARRKK